MKFLRFVGILLILHASRTKGVAISYDFTDPLNAIRVGSLSVEDFSTNVLSHFGHIIGTIFHGFSYSPDCNITVECGPIVNDVIQIWHDVKRNIFPQTADTRGFFYFQFRIEIEEFKNLNNMGNQTKLNMTKEFSDSYWIFFVLPDKTTCDDLKHVTKEHWRILLNPSTWFLPESKPDVAVGYNEDLIGCERLYDAMPTSDTLSTLLSHGETPGVAESFGLFKKKMDYLLARNVEFIKNNPYNNNARLSIVLSSTSQSLGDEYHRHLLESYWGRYKNNIENVGVFALTPMVFGRFQNPKDSAKKIIPYIDADSYLGRNSIPWNTPTALETLSRTFGTVVLTHVEWTSLKANASRSATTDESDIHLDVLIDYTDWLQHTLEHPVFVGCNYNWSQIEDELNELDKPVSHSLQNMKVTTLIFPLASSLTTENLTVNVNTGFARRMSSRLVIGCGLFGPLHYSTASAVVAACKQVNGSVYALQHHFKLNSITKVTQENSQHYENVVRPKLGKMGIFRKEILILHPHATVCFQIRFEFQITDNHATPFCNNEAFSYNEYIEATVNWAALKGIPLIMGRAFEDIDHQKYHTWFSVLRPTEKNLTYFSPDFVFRNSPQILTNVEVEPCLEWSVDRPVIHESYFQKNTLGAHFYPKDMREGKPISRDEYKILLRFILHRFDVVKVALRNDLYEEFITAMSTLSSEGLISPGKSIFLSFYDAKSNLEDYYAFLNFSKVTLGSNISFLKGIAFAWDEISIDKEQASDLTTHFTKALQWGRSLNLNMGLLMRTEVCQNINLNATSQKHNSEEIENFLQTADYLACWESMELSASDNPKRLGTIFETHLYVKRFLQDFYPHLDVHFEVFVQMDVDRYTMPKYLILISHFQKFAATYNLTYLIVKSFDPEGYGYLQPGWWKVSNYSNLSLTSLYVEKYSDFIGSGTWRPPLHFKPTPTTNNANQTTDNESDNKQNIFLGVTTSGFGLMIVVSGLLLWCYRNKKPQYLSNEEAKIFYNGKKGTEAELASGDSEYIKFDRKFELAFADIFIDPMNILGRGNFGTVYKGLVNEEPVAIKRPNQNCPATSFKSVLSELKVLCYVGTHPNVVQFVGAYTKEIRKGILYIATELCSNGSLDGLLRAKKRVILNLGDTNNETIGMEDEDFLYSHDLHRFSKDIANGMEYIVGKNIVHGDLSARNVLLDENLTCKIGDFGLSRKLYTYLEYVKQSQEPLPWKWMAFESLENMQFTSKSDVWSYGVTLWEIYSLGKVPYGGLSWTTGFADELKNGLRLQRPEFATEEIYKAMMGCWELEATERPTFTEMVGFFKHLASTQYTVLEL